MFIFLYKPLFILSFITLTIVKDLQAQIPKQPDQSLKKTIDQNFKDANAQYHVMMKGLPADQFPRSYNADKKTLVTSGSAWWCSGFYPGSLINIYKEANDKELYDEALKKLGSLSKEQHNKTTHDLGFMMYCSFGNAYQIDHSNEYKNILINSAKSLITRFDPKVGCIKSWDSKDSSDYIVIIDNMMNLELLFFATKATGDSTYYKIAVTHANTTMKNHFRPDYSSYHVVNYNAQTGAVKERKTAQGAADESAWARGQAWGLYGYTLMYRETRDVKYLEQAKHIAHFILTNPHMPADKIPYWDFNAPGIPNAPRDASAAAVMASGLLELGTYINGRLKQQYYSTAATIIKNLSGPQYKAAIGTNGGFLLKHSVGHKPAGTEIDVPLTYADYYFIEAMQRYQLLSKHKP